MSMPEQNKKYGLQTNHGTSITEGFSAKGVPEIWLVSCYKLSTDAHRRIAISHVTV
jgi:hypothetical protein